MLSDASHRRGRIQLNEFRASGHLAASPIADFPGEQALLLRKAYDLAQQNGLSMAALADRLALSPRRIRAIVGDGDPRPTLTLVQD